jgi:hypothetical protein
VRDREAVDQGFIAAGGSYRHDGAVVGAVDDGRCRAILADETDRLAEKIEMLEVDAGRDDDGVTVRRRVDRRLDGGEITRHEEVAARRVALPIVGTAFSRHSVEPRCTSFVRRGSATGSAARVCLPCDSSTACARSTATSSHSCLRHTPFASGASLGASAAG